MTHQPGDIVEKVVMGKTVECTLVYLESTVQLDRLEDGKYQQVRKITLKWRAFPGVDIIEQVKEPIGEPFAV